MTSEHKHPGRHLTFSQRYGYEDLPEPMRPGQISDDLRREVWNAFSKELSEYTIHDAFGTPDFNWDGEYFVKRVLGKLLKKPEDEISADYSDTFPRFKGTILTGPFNFHIDLLEAVINDDAMASLAIPMKILFEEHAAPYRLDTAQRPFKFFPTSSAEQAEAVQEALHRLQAGDMQDAFSGFRLAAEHINAGNYGDSVAKSHYAVEAVAKQIDPRDGATLGKAVQSLIQDGILADEHITLKQAIGALDGYAHNAGRHAPGKKAPVVAKQRDALFVYGICVSLADYLVAKHREQ